MKLIFSVVLILCVVVAVDAGFRKAKLKKCQRQAKEIEEQIENGLQDAAPPACTETGHYERKQCYTWFSCTCVTRKKGKPKYEGVQIPHGHDFDCTRPPTKCERKLFKAVIESRVGGGFIDEDSLPKCTLNDA